MDTDTLRKIEDAYNRGFRAGRDAVATEHDAYMVGYTDGRKEGYAHGKDAADSDEWCEGYRRGVQDAQLGIAPKYPPGPLSTRTKGGHNHD